MKKIALAFFALMNTLSASAQKEYSQRWGKNGEKRDKTKLLDFTHPGWQQFFMYFAVTN